MASFDTTKIAKDISAGTYKKSKNKVPKYIYVKNKRGRLVKKLNPKWSIKQKVDKYVSDRKVPINKVSTKDQNKKIDKPKNVPVQEKKDNKVNKEKVKTPKYKQVTQTELDAKLAEDKKGKESLKAKPKKLIKKKKGKGFVSTKSARGKQLLKIEERKRKLREKRFGKK